MNREDQEKSFDVWWEMEGKDMMPVKESVKIAWLNGVYVAERDIECKSCENCIFNVPRDNYCLKLENYGMKYCSKWEEEK